MMRAGGTLDCWKTHQSTQENTAEPPKLLPRPKHPLVEKIMKLPPQKRIEFFNRFEACGAFER